MNCIIFQCSDAPKCSCVIGDKTVPVEANTSGNEALAGAVGAMSSLLLAGSGFCVWRYCKSNQTKSETYGRPNSSSSTNKLVNNRPDQQQYSDIPRKKPDTATSTLPPSNDPYTPGQANVYRASAFASNRSGNHRPYTGHYSSASSDWG